MTIAFCWIERRKGELDTVHVTQPDQRRGNSHPPLAERIRPIAGAGAGPDDGAPADQRPAIELIVDREAALSALDADACIGTLTSAAQDAAKQDADELYAAAAMAAGTKRVGLGSVLDILELGRGEALRAALPQTTTFRGFTDLVVAAIGAHLVTTGHAR